MSKKQEERQKKQALKKLYKSVECAHNAWLTVASCAATNKFKRGCRDCPMSASNRYCVPFLNYEKQVSEFMREYTGLSWVLESETWFGEEKS